MTQPRPHKRTTAAAWQWIRNSGTPSKSRLRQSKKRSFPRGRSDIFGTPIEEQKRVPVCRHKRTTAAAWQWIRNSWTPSKSGLRQSKNRTFPRGRSGAFRNAKGKEKSPSTLAKNVTQPSPHKRTTAAAWGNGFETAEHHLHPGSGKAKTDHSPGAEVAPLEPLEEKTRGPVRRHKRTTAAAWQWIRNSWTPSKSGLRQGKKLSFPRGRSGTFGTPKGKEKSPSR